MAWQWAPLREQDAQRAPLARQEVSPRARLEELEVSQTERAAHQPVAWRPVRGAVPRRRARDVRDVLQEASVRRELWVLHAAQAQPEEPRAARARVPVQLAAQHAGPARQPEVQAVLDAAAAAVLRAQGAAVRRQEEPAAQGVARAEQQQVAVRGLDVAEPAVRLRVGPPSVALSAELWVLPCARLQAQAGRPVPG